MTRPQRVHQLLRAGGSKADEIDNCIRIERGDPRSERPCGVLGRPVDVDPPHSFPRRVRNIRVALATAGNNYIVARIDKPRDEERADVTGSADDDKSHCGYMLAMIQRCRVARLDLV